MNNNSLAWIIGGVLAFLMLIFGAKWLMDNKHDHEHFRRFAQPQQSQPAAPQVIVAPPAAQPIVVLPPQYPYHCPNYHGNREFWVGYRDGFNGLFPQDNCPEYREGYQIGVYDRKCGKSYYYNRYWNEPGSGFNLKINGFNLNIR